MSACRSALTAGAYILDRALRTVQVFFDIVFKRIPNLLSRVHFPVCIRDALRLIFALNSLNQPTQHNIKHLSCNRLYLHSKSFLFAFKLTTLNFFILVQQG